MEADVTSAGKRDRLQGEVIEDRYRLEDQIGEGGIGRVYRARHLTLGSFVAVKVLLAEYQDQPTLRKRFEREASALAELSHPNIVKVSDFGVTSSGMPFIAMELLEGDDLAALIAAGEVDPIRGRAIVRQVLRALAFAHGRDVVHRDIKPHNIFVRPMGDGTDHVTVLDFGLARFVSETSGAEKAGRPLTKTGTVLGTPAYMAPEQATGDTATATADVYAAGVLFYEVLAGQRPFTSRDPGELLRAHLLQTPPPVTEVRPALEVSPEVDAFLERAMAKAPSDRFADAKEMLAALDVLGADAISLSDELDERPRPAAEKDFGTAHTLAASVDAVVVPDAQPSRSSSSPPTRAIGLAIAGAVVASLGLGTAYLIFGGDDDSGPTETTADDPVVVDDLEVEADPEPDPPSPARDPLAGSLPDELAPAHAKVQRGRPLARREIGNLNVYGRRHPEDARSRLILAHHYTDVRSLSWAFPQYEEAFEIDPAVRADPEMLPDLIEMARSGSLHANAVRLIGEVYGEDALPAVEAELEGRVRREERRRLERLRDHLEGG